MNEMGNSCVAVYIGRGNKVILATKLTPLVENRREWSICQIICKVKECSGISESKGKVSEINTNIRGGVEIQK